MLLTKSQDGTAGRLQYIVHKGSGLCLVLELEHGLKRGLPVSRCVLENTVGIEEDVFYGHALPRSALTSFSKRKR